MKSIIALLLLSNASAHRLQKEPVVQINRHDPDFDLNDASYLQHKAEPAKDEKGPDCDKFPNAVGCQIGVNATHVNIPMSKEGAVGSAELTDAVYGGEPNAGGKKGDGDIVKDMKNLMQMQAQGEGGPDCTQNPYAVNCKIGESSTHVNIPVANGANVPPSAAQVIDEEKKAVEVPPKQEKPAAQESQRGLAQAPLQQNARFEPDMHEIEELAYVNLKNKKTEQSPPQSHRHEPDMAVLDDATYLQHKVEPAKEGKGKEPDCDKFPNAVGCQIGVNKTHVNIHMGAGPSAELQDIDYGASKKGDKKE